ncbi:MAG: hypothetical protein M1570_11320 [Chloroflexi bacterium]|nr:hypothetical protein [Chloroflexota bacterium]
MKSMPMTLSQLWDLCFTCFEVFIGVGVLWMWLVEPRLPALDLSFPVMTALAVLGAGVFFVRGWRQAKLARELAQRQIDAATARFEEEIG